MTAETTPNPPADGVASRRTGRKAAISPAQTAAAVVGAFFCSMAITMLASGFLPVPQIERAIGSGFAFPLVWLGVTIATFLARSAAVAWIWLVGVTLLALTPVALRVIGVL